LSANRHLPLQMTQNRKMRPERMRRSALFTAMRDRLGREIDYMRISVTDRCNLRCKYCMPEEGVAPVAHSRILTYDEITRIVRCAAADGIRYLRLTGGEPLVRKNLDVLVRQLREVPGIRSVALTTNGTLLKEKMDVLYDSGIRYVNVSLDSADAALYSDLTRGGRLEDALAGIREALRYPDVTVKADCVLLGLPSQKIEDVASLAKNERLHVRFIELMPVGTGRTLLRKREGAGNRPEDDGEIRFMPGSEAKARIEKAFGRPELCGTGGLGHGPAVYYSYPGFLGKIGYISAVSSCFCENCNRVRLTSQGFFKACLQYDVGCDLRSVLRSGQSGLETDRLLTQMMRETLLKKPDRHRFSGQGEWPAGTEMCGMETRGMSGIGG